MEETKTTPAEPTPLPNAGSPQEVFITIDRMMLNQFLVELQDWFYTHRCATVSEHGTTFKNGVGFVRVHWKGSVPAYFCQKLNLDSDILDFLVHPQAR